ncbi:MAG: AAA family ATPase [Muribaculaceae bacterium]|nr:AAA family ATPase [Muribaculaceae bacterium]
MEFTKETLEILEEAKTLAFTLRHEYLLPEHFLRLALHHKEFIKALDEMDADRDSLAKSLDIFLNRQEKVPENMEFTLSLSNQFEDILEEATEYHFAAEVKEIGVPHLVSSLLQLDNSNASYLLGKAIDWNTGEFLSLIIAAYGGEDSNDEIPAMAMGENEPSGPSDKGKNKNDSWRSFVTCINDDVERRNPLIGRERELARTIQVLCRKDKNNPLHVGEPGVGKTALVYGLARMINEGRVPDRLKGAKIYGLEIASLLAGTQFRGDFEKRLKTIMDGVAKEENVIIYIDEIHNLVGAGATGEGSMDASNMLKPYLESGKIRFIGSTTFDEYKRYFAKSKGLVRRFSQIDIIEPSVDEAINILNQLKGSYESYHGVTYLPEAIDYAVKGSARHITDRFLPDKAIDLIDEAGAYRQAHKNVGEENSLEKGNIIDRELIAEILSKVCKIDAVSMRKDSVASLEDLGERISGRIYGQDDAVRAVTEAVQMSRAGLNDDNKPLASLLFVGPTGVGKTELAKSLAEELGIGLVRFDMSEYAEKHTVAKLIGSPAGYVGYEDGGLLTDAIRKTPDCVLLLDEIEKAHPDIYNILLQVMDYASLTDSKGNKADFRNVVIIMTSNAGARYASQANVGFGSSVSAGTAMMKQVKKTFQPEFLNRLSATVMFNDMDRHMASLILDKKLRGLEDKLRSKNVTLSLSEEAREHLLAAGFSKEYGAREMDRVIGSELKPILMREILFGKLKEGGEAVIGLSSDNKLELR